MEKELKKRRCFQTRKSIVMEAMEIRIGNYVLANGVETIVESIDKNGINFEYGEYLAYHGDLLKPIPLTEEWLLEFGFEDLIRGTYICKHQIVLKKESKGYSYEKFSNEKILITSVHQLQNLYFFLTGSELVRK